MQINFLLNFFSAILLQSGCSVSKIFGAKRGLNLITIKLGLKNLIYYDAL